MKPANFFQRFAAYAADTLILLFVMLMVQMLLELDVENGDEVAIVNLVVSTAYFVYFHFRSGATPGKRLMEIRVVCINTEPLTLLQAFLRYLPYSLGFALSILLQVDPQAEKHPPSAELFFSLFIGWHIASVTILFMREDRRTLHDLLAYTQVIYQPQSRQEP